MLASRSVHIDCTVYVSGGDERESQDFGATDGRVVNTSGDISITALLVDGVAYIKTNNAGVMVANGIPASQADSLVGKWIAMHPGDSTSKGYLNYDNGTHGMTLAKQADALQLASPLKRTEARMVEGVRAYGVSGGATSYYADQDVKGSAETVYVAASGPPLPVSVSVHANMGTTTCNFSRWGEPLHLTDPAGAVPLSSIPGAEAST